MPIPNFIPASLFANATSVNPMDSLSLLSGDLVNKVWDGVGPIPGFLTSLTGVENTRNIFTGLGLSGGGDLSADRTIDLRLNASGGLSKTLGAGLNELGIAALGVTAAMLAGSIPDSKLLTIVSAGKVNTSSLTGIVGTANGGTGLNAIGTALQVLRVNGAGTALEYATISVAVPTGANPTATIGLTVINGSATTFMRSDAAPALSQAIVPTWSGLHTFQVNPIVTNAAPGLIFTDTTASAKGLTIAVDANLAQFRESAGASGSLMVLDLTNNRVGVGTASPTQALDVAGFVNVAVTSGYKQNGTTVLYADANSTPVDYSTRIGVGVLISNSIAGGGLNGLHNTGVGYRALFSNTTGRDNNAIGYFSLFNNTTGVGNNAIGSQAMQGGGAITGTGNNAMGSVALNQVTSGSDNCAVGSQSLQFNTTGSRNSGIGTQSGSRPGTGNDNVYIGYLAGLGQFASASSKNVCIGNLALGTLNGGNNNIGIGHNAGVGLTTGSNNLILGYLIDFPSNTASNQMNIGALLFSDGLDATGANLASGGLGVGVKAPAAKLHVIKTDTMTGAISTLGIFGHNISSGTPTTGLGTEIQLQGQSNNTANRSMAAWDAQYVVATDGSRTIMSCDYVWDFGGGGGGTKREAMRRETDGTQIKLSVFGVPSVARQVGGAATATLVYTATEQGMIQTMWNALRSYGWLT